MGVVDDALRFAALGYSVFPVHQKQAQLKKWPDLATTDKDTITEWFEGKYAYCDSFGICPAHKCVVIDVDVKKEKVGLASLKVLKNDLGLNIQTFAVKTPSGGIHLYYQYPPNTPYIKSISNWFIPDVGKMDGIDIRGTRGFVVGPTEANDYRILQDTLPAELPANLIEALPVAEDQRESVRLNPKDAEALITEESQQLRGNIPESIPLGERHDTIIRLMASWARKVHYEQAVILLQEAVRRCEQSEDDFIRVEDYTGRLDEAYTKFTPVIEDKLQWMLDNLVLINSGNRVFDRSRPPNVSSLKLGEAKTHFANWIDWEEKTSASGAVSQKPSMAFSNWIRHTKRQSMSHLGYKPTSDQSYYCNVLGCEVANAYRAPKHKEPEGEVPSVEPFLEFADYLLGEDADYFLKWAAHLVQRPYRKIMWAPVVVTTKEGIGKNFMFDILSNMVGRWNTFNMSASIFHKSFNSFLVQSVLVLINELEEVDPRRRVEIASRLKSYITERDQTIEHKGQDPYLTEIFTNFILFSNREDALHIENDSRRFFVHINHTQPRSPKYYRELYSWLLNGGYYAVYMHLRGVDLRDFAYDGRAPDTESKELMVTAARSQEETLIRAAIDNRVSIFRSDIVTHDAWHYYVANVLHQGRRMTSAHQKHLFSKLFVSIRQLNGKTSRQMRVTQIGMGSDAFVILPGQTEKMSVWTCRNHGMYDNEPNGTINLEFVKIFDATKEKKELHLVR